MPRVAAIIILEDEETRDMLLDWADERELPLSFTDDMKFVADIADGLPTNHLDYVYIEFQKSELSSDLPDDEADGA